MRVANKAEMDVLIITSVVVMVAGIEGKAAPLKGSMNYEAYHLLNLSEISNKSSSVSEGSCLDHRGKVISDGARYFPLVNDPCTQCTCLNGKPEMCISVFCSPPENCRQFHELNDKCCEFVCLDRDPSDKTGNGTVIGIEDADSINATNLGLRLVASTVTSFLILALLLFMIHRLHQRRLLLMIRRFHARRVDTGSNGSQRFPLDDEGSVGYLVGGDHVDFSHCSEPPPPYTFWKPPETYIPPGEAPPPYEASVGTIPPIYNGASIRNSISDNQTLECNRDVPQQTVSQQIPSLLLASSNVPDTCLSTSTSETSHTQHIGRHGRVASTSSISMMSDSGDTNSHTDMNTLRSDAHYEDVPVYMPNNVTILRIGQGGNIVSTALCEEDLANGNILPNDMSPEGYEKEQTTDKGVGCSVIRKGSKSHSCQHKHHSCSEISEWKQNIAPKGENSKRCSLQAAPVNKVVNKAYPDPTSWIGEGSETSSSSSPTYEQCTFSPSSSDSSSMEVDFHLDANSQDVSSNNGQNTRHCSSRQNVFQDGKVCNSNAPTSVREKNTSLDKTLQHLRKFSLTHRKKKKRKNRADIQQVLRASAVGEDGAIEDYGVPYQVCSSSGHTFQNSDSVQKLHFNCKKSCDSLDCQSRRPASLCLVVRSPNELRDGRSKLKPISPESQNGCTPVPATVVAVHCSAAARVNRLGTVLPDNLSVSPDFNSESVQAYISEQYALHASSPGQESSPSNPKCGISRSGSICSETGERRYHGNNSPKGIYGCSHFATRGSSHEKVSNVHPPTTSMNKNTDILSHTSHIALGSVPHEENISSISEYNRLHSKINSNSEEDNRGYDVKIIKKPKHSSVNRQETETKMSQQMPSSSFQESSELANVSVKSTRNDQSRKHRATSSKETDEDLCSSHL